MRTLSRKIVVLLLCALCFNILNFGCRRQQAPTGPAFDVPRLIDKDIKAIQSTLGPESPTPPKLPPLPNENRDYKSWSKHGQWLTVEYSKSSGLVAGFMLSVDAQSESLKDSEKETFLKTGNLKEGETRYSIAFMEAGEVFRFTGVKITPQQTMHTVVFRVSGSSSLLQVGYAVGTGSTPQTFMTIPPWEHTESAAIDTQLSLEAVPVRADGVSPGPNLQMTVQILVNGKVLCENSSSGAPAKCSITL